MRGYARFVLIGLLILGLFCGGALAESAPDISDIDDTPSFTSAVVSYSVNQSDAATNVAYGLTSALGSWSVWSNDSTSHNVDIINLNESTTYFYSIYAYNGTNNSYSSNSSIDSFTTLTPTVPTAPGISSISDTPSFTSAIVSYSVNQSDAATNVAYGLTSALGSWSLWFNDSTSHNANILDLNESTTYFYSIYAYNGTNNSYSSNSSIDSFTTLTPTLPTAPGISSISDTPSFTSAVVSYSVNQSDAATNVAYGLTSALGSWSLWFNDSTSHNANILDLNESTTYFYSIYAYNGTNNSYSSNSSIDSFTTLTPTLPTAPGISSVGNDAPTADKVIINYLVDQSDAGTRVAYSTNSSLTSPRWSSWDNALSPYNVTISGLTDGTTYYYSVYAYNGTNNSYSNNSSIYSFATLSNSGNRIWEEGMSLNYIWTAKSYSGFYYDLDSGLGSESMEITLSSGSRSVGSGKLNYFTEPINTKFEYTDWGSYQIIGFMAERYFAGYPSGTFDLTSDISLISHGQMSKVLMNEKESRSVYAGSALILEEGYTLNIVELDKDGNKVYVTLTKDGSELESTILSSGKNYTYEKDLGSADDVPIIAVYFDEIFSGAETSAVFVKGIFQISDEYITIKSGDNYGKMEVDSFSADEIKMSNDDSFSLSEGNTIDIMGKIKFLVADNDVLRFAPFVDMTEPGTYELRGTATNDTEFEWTPLNFEGFYYSIDEGIATESLTITDRSGTSIGEHKLIYTATPANVSFEYTKSAGWGTGYDVVGFMTGNYFAGYPSGAFDTTSSAISIISDGQLSKVLINEDKSRAIHSGSGLILDEGYVLNIIEVDRDGNKVAVSLSKDGSEIGDMSVVTAGDTYVYEKDLGSSDDVPIIAVHFDNIFQGAESSAIFVDGIFQISDQYITVEDGDTYGKMKVTSTSGEIVMTNDDSISLTRGKSIPIMGDILFKVADDDDVRYYPYVEISTAPLDSLDISMPATVKQDDSMTITVTSRGATVSDVAVKFDDDNVGSTSTDGTLTYKPALSGTYTVTAEKEGYVSASGEVEIISPLDETKKMSIEVSPGIVYEGNQLTISTIKAIGGEAIEDVNVSYDGSSLGTTSADGTLSYTVKEPGMHKLTATKTGLLDAELNFEVLALEAKFEFSNLVITPLEVKMGKDVTITFNASNTGKAAGEYNVDLMINGNLTESRQIALNVSESITIEFTVSKDEPGTYLVETNGLSGTFEVLEKSGGVALYVLGILGVFAAVAVGYMFTAGGWTVEMVSTKVAEFIESIR